MAIKKSVAEGFARGELYDIVKWQDGAPYGATFTLGANNGTSGKRKLSIQLTDYLNQPLSNMVSVLAYVSDASGNIDAATGLTIADGGSGTLKELVTKHTLLLVTDSNGKVDIEFTQGTTGTTNVYITVVLANNTIATTGQIAVTKS